MNCSEFEAQLDAYLDGELEPESRLELEGHARNCEHCGRMLRAGEQLGDFLSHMEDAVSVPLAAQAAWRKAVKAEASRKRMRRIYGAVSAVAAACVLVFGVGTMLNTHRPQEGTVGENHPAQKVAFVETDGVAQMGGLNTATVGASLPDADYVELKIKTEDLEGTKGYLMDLIAEYECVVENEYAEDGMVKVYVSVPADHIETFVSAARNLSALAGAEVPVDGTQFCVVLYR